MKNLREKILGFSLVISPLVIGHNILTSDLSAILAGFAFIVTMIAVTSINVGVYFLLK